MKNVPFILALVVISEHNALVFFVFLLCFSDFKVRKCIQFSLIFKPFPPPILTFALGEEHLSFKGMGLQPRKWEFGFSLPNWKNIFMKNFCLGEFNSVIQGGVFKGGSFSLTLCYSKSKILGVLRNVLLLYIILIKSGLISFHS